MACSMGLVHPDPQIVHSYSEGGIFRMALSESAAGFESTVGTREAAIEENVRRLLARELHDRVAQTLTTMLVELEIFKADQVGRQSVLRQVDLLKESTREVLDNLRQLLYELRGEEKVGENLVQAVGELIERFEERTGIAAELNVLPGWPATLRSAAAVNLYRIIEEALRNVRSHSGAGRVEIVLRPQSETQLAVVVSDDGRGLESSLTTSWALGMPGMGTVGMRERAIFLGGELRIENVSGGGTTVRAVFPRDPMPADLLSLKEMPA
jgi:signal transduction histidine kinase